MFYSCLSSLSRTGLKELSCLHLNLLIVRFGAPLIDIWNPVAVEKTTRNRNSDNTTGDNLDHTVNDLRHWGHPSSSQSSSWDSDFLPGGVIVVIDTYTTSREGRKTRRGMEGEGNISGGGWGHFDGGSPLKDGLLDTHETWYRDPSSLLYFENLHFFHKWFVSTSFYTFDTFIDCFSF